VVKAGVFSVDLEALAFDKSEEFPLFDDSLDAGSRDAVLEYDSVKVPTVTVITIVEYWIEDDFAGSFDRGSVSDCVFGVIEAAVCASGLC